MSKLLPLPESERTEANRVYGCQSRVWLSARKRPGTPDTIDFLADSGVPYVQSLVPGSVGPVDLDREHHCGLWRAIRP